MSAERIRLILETVPGERRLLPEFGWRGHELASLESDVERALAALHAERALRRWAADLGVLRVDVVGVSAGRVELSVRMKDDCVCVGITRRRARADSLTAAGKARGAHGP